MFLCPRLIAKIDAMVTDLDSRQNKINEIYAEGAVEGYSNEFPGSIQMITLRIRVWHLSSTLRPFDSLGGIS